MTRALARLRLWIVGATLLAACHAGARTVILDAGHGGHERGGIPGQKVSEKDMALDVTRRVEARLRRAGVHVVLTRKGDYFVPLSTRVAMASRYRGATFVSIHFNATPYNPKAQGIETYYYSSRSFRLAASIHHRLVRAAGTGDRNIRRRGFYVLRRNALPAVLAECGFLTSPREARLVRSSAHREKIAAAIAAGILASN